MRQSTLLRLILFGAVLFAGMPPLLPAQETASSPPSFALERNIHPLPANEALIVLHINGRRFGDVEALIDADDPFIRVSLLREALVSALSALQYERVFGVVLSRLEWAGSADLKAAGFDCAWDMETLRYSITTPGEFAARREIGFASSPTIQSDHWIPPSTIAGVINFGLGGSANMSAAGTSFPLSLNADGMLNLWATVIEANASVFYTSPDISWSFGSVRALRDFPAIEGRLSAGMISGVGIFRQSRPEIYGFSLRNADEFSRYNRNYSPSVLFVLQKPSTIKLSVNGMVIRTIKLDRGNYRLYDIPFAYGLNQFEIEVDEGEGGEGSLLYKPLSRYITLESGLLVGGKTDYGFSAGFGRTEMEQTIASAYVRHGLDSAFTLAAAAEVDQRSVLGELGFVAGTDIGGFIFDASALFAWDNREYPFAFAAGFQYHLSVPAVANSPAFGLSLEYASQGFTAPQPLSAVAVPDAYVKASANIGGPISRTLSFGAAGQWNRSLVANPVDKGTLSVNFGAAMSKNSFLIVSAGINLATNKDPDFSASLTLSATDPLKSNRHVSFMQASNGQNSIVFGDRLPILGGINYGIQAVNPIGGVSAPSSLAINSVYNNPYYSLSGNAALRYGYLQPSPNGTISLNLGTALSFAGGSFAISKPLRDSFVIFDPDRSTGSNKVAFSVGSGEKLISHGWPVAQSLSSYRTVLAAMEFPEADVDTLATLPQAAMTTSLRSGFLYKAGLEKRFYVAGRLTDASGAPIALVVGDVADATGALVNQTFTDENGLFYIYNLGAGDYTIIWPTDMGISAFSLTADSEIQIDLGDIKAGAAAGPPQRN